MRNKSGANKFFGKIAKKKLKETINITREALSLKLVRTCIGSKSKNSCRLTVGIPCGIFSPEDAGVPAASVAEV